jgi:hypothetical protein
MWWKNWATATGFICAVTRRISKFITGKGDTGQNDNDGVVQVRRVDGQPVTGHSMANEQGSHMNPRRSHEGPSYTAFGRLKTLNNATTSCRRNNFFLLFPPFTIAYVSDDQHVSQEFVGMDRPQC